MIETRAKLPNLATFTQSFTTLSMPRGRSTLTAGRQQAEATITVMSQSGNLAHETLPITIGQVPATTLMHPVLRRICILKEAHSICKQLTIRLHIPLQTLSVF